MMLSRAAQDLQARLQAETGILVVLVYSTSVEELQSLLSRFRNVLASRMHAGILAHISGCNTLCLNWDDKVEGMWATVGEEARVVKVDSVTGPVSLACLQRSFAKSHAPTSETISEISRTVLVRLKTELSDRI